MSGKFGWLMAVVNLHSRTATISAAVGCLPTWQYRQVGTAAFDRDCHCKGSIVTRHFEQTVSGHVGSGTASIPPSTADRHRNNSELKNCILQVWPESFGADTETARVQLSKDL